MKADQQLQLDVCAELQWDPSVHSARLGVGVQDGVVTLTGEVASCAEKWRASRAAQRVSGAVALASAVTVQPRCLTHRPQADCAAALSGLHAALERAAGLDEAHGQGQRQVAAGSPTRAATVRHWAARQAALATAWATPGIRELRDRMTLAG